MEETLKKKRPFLFWTAIVCGVGVLSVAGFFFGRKGWAEFKEWRADALAELSGEYAKEGKWNEAAMSADTALRLDPVQPEATRFMAQLMEAEGRWVQAMELYGRLYNSGGGSLEDLKKQAVNAARGNYADPARWLAGVVAEKGEPEFPLVLEAEMLVKKGDVEGAHAKLREAVGIRNSRSARAAMMRFLLERPRKDGGKELFETVWALKDGDDEFAAEALAVGLASGVAAEGQRAEFVQKIRSHPKRTERLLMLADTVEVAVDPGSKPRVAAGMAARLAGAALDERLVGAMWLNSQGQPREALALLPPEDAMKNAAAMRAWLDAAAGLGEWDAMRAVLARKDVPLPAHMAKVYTGRALKMGGKAQEGEAAYRAVVGEFRDRPQETAEILEYLHRSGEYAIFDDGLKAQVAVPAGALDMVSRLVPVVLDARDSARMREVVALALASPNLSDNPALRNDADYLDLVLGRPIDVAALRARREANPGDAALLFTFALERLKAGQSGEALALLENANMDVRTLAPNHLTVLACVLGANGRTNEALQIAAGIPAARISNQELGMMKGFLALPAR